MIVLMERGFEWTLAVYALESGQNRQGVPLGGNHGA